MTTPNEPKTIREYITARLSEVKAAKPDSPYLIGMQQGLIRALEDTAGWLDAHEANPNGCTYSMVSSRMCECGTKGCEVRHEPKAVGAETKDDCIGGELGDGGPAFPTILGRDGASARAEDPNCYHDKGMTLRDYFAAQAMVGLRVGDWSECKDAAKWCFDMANAMLAEREKGTP